VGILAEEKRYSLFLEEVIIRDFFQDRKGGFFVDVGCAWPIRASNTYYLEKHLGWKGIGIDALPDYARAWREKRPASRFFAVLISDQVARRVPFFKSRGLGLSSVSRETASGRSFGSYDEPEEIEVPMTTLDALLEQEGVTKVDLLAMDIEGHEAAALRGFDIERFQPELIVVEGRDREVSAYLVSRGYRLLAKYLELDRVNSYFRPRARHPGLD
jgi:FkbM family methyltransferase